jgi:ABC-type phosphate transport system substrate-binding protein
LKRIVVIAVAAIAALGVGVTVGSTHQEHSASQTLPPGLTAAPQGGQTPDQLCEQAAQQLRARHPDVYVSACNHGTSTLPVP